MNRYLEPGEDHDVYQIQACLGDGKEAQVYRAKQAPEREVALKCSMIRFQMSGFGLSGMR
jgi:serine/threonine-protein kinase RIO1